MKSTSCLLLMKHQTCSYLLTLYLAPRCFERCRVISVVCVTVVSREVIFTLYYKYMYCVRGGVPLLVACCFPLLVRVVFSSNRN